MVRPMIIPFQKHPETSIGSLLFMGVSAGRDMFFFLVYSWD